MRRVLYIVLVVLLVAACGPHRIPRDDMEDIMYRMLVQDQQIKQDPKLRKQADTMLVYEGIFESFGYDTDDFLASLDYYLADASRMEKIMEKVEQRLMEKVAQTEKEVEEESWRRNYLRIWDLKPNTRNLPQPSSPLDTLYLQFNKDSLLYHPLLKK